MGENPVVSMSKKSADSGNVFSVIGLSAVKAVSFCHIFMVSSVCENF